MLQLNSYEDILKGTKNVGPRLRGCDPPSETPTRSTYRMQYVLNTLGQYMYITKHKLHY